jgi:hypothetical protein
MRSATPTTHKARYALAPNLAPALAAASEMKDTLDLGLFLPVTGGGYPMRCSRELHLFHSPILKI